jgi:hypothetical protein
MEREMAATLETRDLAIRRRAIGCVALVLWATLTGVLFKFDKNMGVAPGFGAVILCGMFPGVFSVLVYNFDGRKSFHECMHVSVMPVAALGVVLCVILLMSMFAGLILGGVGSMIMVLLIPLVYFGGALYLPLAALVLSALSCAGGSFIYGVMRIMRHIAEGKRPQWG